FPSPKPPAAAPAGRPAQVTVEHKGEKTTHKVTDLQPLYRLPDGTEKVLPTLFFRKTLKIDVGKIAKMRTTQNREADGTEFEVTLKDNEVNTLTLLSTVTIDNRQARLEGLVGRAPVGYKLIPLNTAVGEIVFDEAK